MPFVYILKNTEDVYKRQFYDNLEEFNNLLIHFLDDNNEKQTT